MRVLPPRRRRRRYSSRGPCAIGGGGEAKLRHEKKGLDAAKVREKCNDAARHIRDPTSAKEAARTGNTAGIPASGVICGLAFVLVFMDGRIIGRADLVAAFRRKLGLPDVDLDDADLDDADGDFD